VARHGLLDLKRQEGRSAAALPLDEQAALSGKPVAGREGAADPEGATEAGEFARALRSCAEGLSPRSLRIWYFRVLLDMSSREIADHPEVALKASHVDVLLHRIRTVIQECMEKRGQRWGQLPPGTFTLIWELISRCGQDTGPGGEDD